MLTLDELPFAENPALFGANRVPGLVSVLETEDGVELFTRVPQGLKREQASFEPFLWLADPELLKGTKIEHRVETLAGPGFFNHLVRCPDWGSIKKLSSYIAKTSGISANSSRSSQLFLSDPVNQYLLDSGRTMFNGLSYESLKRLQLVVYSDVQPGFDSSAPADDAILMVGLSDSTGWEEVLSGVEEHVVARALELIELRDPDLIEGHDLMKDGLLALYERARANRLGVELGRGGQAISFRRSRMYIAERTIDYPRWSVAGRELVDTWILAQLFDVSARELPGYELYEIARHLRLGTRQEAPSPAARAGLSRLEMEAVMRADLADLRAVARTLAYPYFLQAQVFPYAFEHVMLRGNATRINSLFLREYLRRGSALPARPETREFAGGLTAQERTGIARGVRHCDVQSLYPSIILQYNLEPAGDHLHIFLGMLRDLRSFRLEARKRQREAAEPEAARFYEALQTIFKILINSFYGYLGFPQGNFADFQVAAQVTAHGREILTTMMEWLRARGAQILEVDTDGIYFQPPAGELGDLNAVLPAGITVEMDGNYPAMFCHRMKNYALLEEDGSLTLRGSGLRSRSQEPFLRETLETMIRLALHGETERIPALLEETRTALQERRVPVAKLARTEILSDPMWSYRKKIEAGARNRAAAYELALRSGRKYVAGDSLTYYITGTKASVTAYDNCKAVFEYAGDENVPYYLKKLAELEKKFLPLLQIEL